MINSAIRLLIYGESTLFNNYIEIEKCFRKLCIDIFLFKIIILLSCALLAVINIGQGIMQWIQSCGESNA